jgi:hypothetical protein
MVNVIYNIHNKLKLTDEQEKVICQRYLSGMSRRESGKIYGISSDIVERVLLEHNIDISHKHNGVVGICRTCGQQKKFPEDFSNCKFICKLCHNQKNAERRRIRNEVRSKYKPRPRDNAPEGFKTCWKCLKIFPETTEFFYGIPRPYCKNCQNNITSQKYRKKIYKVLSYYSDNCEPKCACCGENNIRYLTINHINGGGN